MRVVVTGASGFIGSHLAKALRRRGNHVVGVDWRRPDEDCIQVEDSCDEFVLADLRSYRECLRATAGADRVFHLAADMGGMGLKLLDYFVFRNVSMYAKCRCQTKDA